VAEKMGLPGLDSCEVLETLLHKDRFRKFAAKWNISTPRAKGFLSVGEAMEEIDAFTFPVLLKPVDLTGGKGISKLWDKSEVAKAVDYALTRSKTNRFIIEEYITPDDCHHNFVAFLSYGKVVFYNSDNEHYFKNPFLVWGMSIPTISRKVIDEELCKIAERIASILKLKSGILLMQHVSQNGKPIVIEASRRMPGNYHGKLIEYATGCNISEWAIKVCMGDDCGSLSQSEPEGYFAEHCIMAAHAGRVKEIRFNESIENKILEKIIWGQKGDVIKDELAEKLGIVLMKFDSFDEMWTKMERMDQIIHVEIE
jgi:biotin carboxylase